MSLTLKLEVRASSAYRMVFLLASARDGAVESRDSEAWDWSAAHLLQSERAPVTSLGWGLLDLLTERDCGPVGEC